MRNINTMYMKKCAFERSLNINFFVKE